jgi:hypothetical protein
MPATRENNKTQTNTQSPATLQSESAQARLAAVVEAAYILEARTR